MRKHQLSLGIGGLLLFAVAPAAAQYVDPRTCDPSTAACDSARRAKRDSDEAYDKERARREAQRAKAEEEQRRALLRMPPLTAERNPLLGSWRLDAGERSNAGGPGRGTAHDRAVSDFVNTFSLAGLDKLGCTSQFGGGVSFTPLTYVRRGAGGLLGGSSEGGGVAYRSAQSGAKRVTVAIPNDARQPMMAFEVADAGRIVYGNNCVLVRVDAPASPAAANTTAAPGNARTAAATAPLEPTASQAARPAGVVVDGAAYPQVAAVTPSPPPSGPTRPSAEVCRNTLLDKLGTAGADQVRAMARARFEKPAVERKLPETGNLRIELQGSACDDPRVKWSVYDFDDGGVLRSITYAWERPAGPVPAQIFTERVATLSRFHALPPPHLPERMVQAEISLGRLVLEDRADHNLLIESYHAPR